MSTKRIKMSICVFLAVFLAVLFPAGIPGSHANAGEAVDTTLVSLEAQAAAAGIGVRLVNGVRVFHTKDGHDLRISQIIGAGEGVIDEGGELVPMRQELEWQLGLPVTGEIYQTTGGASGATPMNTSAQISPVCYSQKDARWSRVLVGTTSCIPSTQDPSKLDSGNTMWRMVALLPLPQWKQPRTRSCFPSMTM